MSKKLRHYRIEILSQASDFKTAHTIAQDMIKKCPYSSRILKLEEVVDNTEK